MLNTLSLSADFRTPIRRIVATLLCLLLPATATAADDPSPEELVRDTSSRMLHALKEEQRVIDENPNRLYELVADIVLPYFDFHRMGRLALGRYWRTASPDQRERFVEQFRILLIRTYGSALAKYTDETIVYLPVLGDHKGKVITIRTEIEQGDGMPIPINYDMYRTRHGWKVYDVAINGISLVTNYRTSFASIVRKNGMEDLIEQLAERNRTTS